MTQWINSIRADLDHAERLDADLEYFAANYLKIRPKTGALEPLVFNDAQRELHRRLEEQKAKTGKVRAVVLKARQLGISTYIGGRFFKRTIQCPGLRTIIIAHEKPASNNLYKMVRRFCDHMPPEVRPSIGTDNAQELMAVSLMIGHRSSIRSTPAMP
jgi:hypothetical protein